CGSFDPLIPYLMAELNLHIVAMDEPGCGFSSHKPVGSDYERWGTLRDMKRVIQFMGWKKVTLLGHSQGAHYSFIFAATYPEIVERVISIDMVKPLTLKIKPNVKPVRDAIETRLKYDIKIIDDSSPPVYSEDEAANKWIESSGNSVNERSVKILLKRGSKKVNGGVIFTRDIRLKLRGIDPLPSNEVMLQMLSNIRCDLLVIDA
ncbi:serine hydrolase-like protein, partial [Leptotrombidium deliense]